MAEDALKDEDLDESLEDLEDVDNWASGAVLWSTDWTAETIVSQLNRGNIDLDPSFQRRSAWTEKKQSLFIESLILGLPIPQLILADAKGKKGAFIVIDGKQRLLAIRRFGSTDEAAGFKPLKLKGLRERDDLNNKTYNDLLGDNALADDLAAFQNSSIRTIVIRNWQSEAYLYEVFLRINTGSVQLSPQELRQALYPGPFSLYVSNASADSIELQRALQLKAPDFRMRDAELLLRYIAYKNFIQQYPGNLKKFLDETTNAIGAQWDQRKIAVEGQVAEMELALGFTREAFGEGSYLRKWNGTHFEQRKNRAVFDIMLHYFSEPAVRQGLIGHFNEVVERFKDLCANDVEFLASIETTTKSMGANRKRFNSWGDAVAELSGVNVDHLKFPA
ncbi:MAG: DUF262 domain-containing protein [Mesorhizobium sp.]|nr:MAG: DUF262 domain-containing protein [Mesorhizobium sp.]